VIHYVSSGGEPIDRVLQTLLTCYGVRHQQLSMPTFPEWQLDELVSDPLAQAILSDCDPLQFETYLERLPMAIDTPAHWWQALLPDRQQVDRIVARIAGFTDRYHNLSYTFLLNQSYQASIWKTLFKRVNPDTIRIINSNKNKLARFSYFELNKLNYTSSQKQVRNCLVYPRADRHTNDLVADTLLTVSQIHPIFYYQNI
jgi:hypothetical protein